MKICELATGRKFTEEWTFLPDTSAITSPHDGKLNGNHLVDFERGIFNENYLLLDFQFAATKETGDLLMLNLVSRKQFWMMKQQIGSKIQAKAPEVDFYGRHYNVDALNNLNLRGGSHRMNFERSEIEISFRLALSALPYYWHLLTDHLGMLNITFV